MTVETFFEKFELFADAPDAIEKMRSFVLALAVGGRLSEQRGDDKPATQAIGELLDRISERDGDETFREFYGEWMARHGLEKKPLPNGWGWAFSELVGETKPRVKAEDDTLAAFIPMAFVPTDHRASVRFEPRAWKEIKKGYTHVSDGDVAFAKITPCFQNGKACVIRGLPNGVGAGTTELHVLRPDLSVIDPRFALVVYRSPGFVEGGVATFTGTAGQQRVAVEYFQYSPFALPPLAEQKRIVAKVDELMTLCDRLEAQQKEREAKHAHLARAALARFAEAPTPANLEYLFHNAYTIDPADLRKSILSMAINGDLLPFETADNETASDHVEFLNGYAFKSEWFKPNGVRLCRNINIGHSEFDWREVAFVDEDIADEFKRFALNEGDIVLSLDRPLISTGLKVARIKADDLPCLLLQRVARPTPKHDGLHHDFLYLWLNSPAFTDSIDPGRSNGVPHISTRQVEKLPFRLPPLAEQRRIVAKVDALMALVDRLEAQLAESRELAGRLMEAVVAELTRPAEPVASDAGVPDVVEQKAETFDLFGQPDQSEQYLRNAVTVAVLVIQRMGKHNGKTFLEKNLHLVESFCDVPMGREPRRMEHGPADLRQHDAIMDWAAANDVLLCDEAGEGVRASYVKGERFTATIADAPKVLGERYDAVVDVLRKLRLLSTKDAEWVATAYGSWNDLIKDGITNPTDAQIIHDIHTNWHISKREVSEADWRKALNWLRDNGIIPNGKGPRVISQAEAARGR